MEDVRILKDTLYGEIASRERSVGHHQLRYKDVCKRDKMWTQRVKKMHRLIITDGVVVLWKQLRVGPDLRTRARRKLHDEQQLTLFQNTDTT